jgi:hypothetical protein
VPLGVDTKHVTDHTATFYLVLGYVQYVARSRLGFNRQQYAASVVDCDYVWEACTTPAKSPGVPHSIVHPLDKRVFIAVTSAAANISQQASVEHFVSLKFLKGASLLL